MYLDQPLRASKGVSRAKNGSKRNLKKKREIEVLSGLGDCLKASERLPGFEGGHLELEEVYNKSRFLQEERVVYGSVLVWQQDERAYESICFVVKKLLTLAFINKLPKRPIYKNKKCKVDF